MTRPDPTEREQGSVLVTVAVSLLAVVIITGFVVDLGMIRNRKTDLRRVADIAALAAGYHLGGHGNDQVISDPRNACLAAWRAVVRNLRDVPTTASMPCSQLPTDTSDCAEGVPMRTVTATGAASYLVTVDYPVPDSEIADPRFETGLGTGDGYLCERMRVSLQQRVQTALAGIVGIDTLTTKVSAVIRGAVSNPVNGVPAFLMLDRTACQVVTNASNGNGNGGIRVRAAATQGGRIHVDTNASECGTNSTDYAIYGTPLSGGGTSITVDNGPNLATGSITSYSVAAGSTRNGSTYPGGLSHPVTAGPVVSRQPFDDRYNSADRPAITDLHSSSYAAVRWTTAQAAANGYTVLPCAAQGTITAEKVFIDCPAGWAPATTSLPNATHLVVNGKVSISSGRSLSVPYARYIGVKGCGTCTGSARYAIDVRGAIYVNIGAQPLASASCLSRLGPGAGGTTTNTTVMALMDAPLQLQATARLCQTTVYMGASRSAYQREVVTTGPPNCSRTRPCPVRTGVPGGGAYFVTGTDNQWIAPNQLTTPADENHPFEDLGLWSETTDLFEVKSGGAMETGGIFFSPNGAIEYRSPAFGRPLNAQFIARRIALLQGTLDMQPVTSDSVAVPLPGSYGLIR